MTYPEVIGEFDTLRELVSGKSLARLGDGELKMMAGQGYAREPANKQMSTELRKLVTEPNSDCLVGIPTMDPRGPKYQSWIRHHDRFCHFLGDIQFYSAFISRPDSAPWIECMEFAELARSLWLGKRVSVVCEPTNKILTVLNQDVEPNHVVCPSVQAFDVSEKLADKALSTNPDIVLLSCGPAATCMANRLSVRVQAVDIGGMGGMLARWLC